MGFDNYTLSYIYFVDVSSSVVSGKRDNVLGYLNLNVIDYLERQK